MTSPVIGAKIEKDIVVTKEHFASSVGSGSIDVLATPVIINLMETCANELSNKYLGKGHTTVGIKVNIDHVKPSVEGTRVRVWAKLIKVDGRKFCFEVGAFDEMQVVVAQGIHERIIVNTERFLEKAHSQH